MIPNNSTASGAAKILDQIKRMGGKVLFFSQEEHSVSFGQGHLLDGFDIKKLTEQARRAGLANQPLSQSLIQSVISQITARHNAQMQNYRETLPDLRRRKEALRAYCSARFDEDGQIREEPVPRPVPASTLYDSLNHDMEGRA